MQHEEALARLGAEVRRLRLLAGLSQERLAVRVGGDQAQVSKVERGRKPPSATFVRALDEALAAEGALVDLHTGISTRTREDDTDRRQFLGGIGAAALAAADVSRRLTTAGPDPLTADELEAEIDGIATAYLTTPHAALEPRIVAGWERAEAALAGRTSLALRARLTVLAGQYSYYMGRLAFNTGDDKAARTFAVLAGQHAEDAGDPQLSGSVAGMRSTLAYYSGRWQQAADIAARAGEQSNAYLRPRLAAYEARAHAAEGRPDPALAALRVMRDAPYEGGRLLGESAFDQVEADIFEAGILARLGRGAAAEPAAERAARATAAQGRFEGNGGVRVHLARSLVARPKPDPAAAADLTRAVLDDLEASPTHTVRHAANLLTSQLAARWPDVREVRDLTERA